MTGSTLKDAMQTLGPSEPIPTSEYGSKFREDRLVGDVLFLGRKGVFVDVGAGDGRVNSVTYYLEVGLGWTGMAIEPHEVLFQELRQNRRCDCFNVAASDSARKTQSFVKAEAPSRRDSGLLLTWRDKRQLELLNYEVVPVRCLPLSQMLLQKTCVDLLSVRASGHEMQVLKGLDFTKVTVKIVCVSCRENEDETLKLDSFLAARCFMPFLQTKAMRFYAAGWRAPSTAKLSGLT